MGSLIIDVLTALMALAGIFFLVGGVLSIATPAGLPSILIGALFLAVALGGHTLDTGDKNAQAQVDAGLATPQQANQQRRESGCGIWVVTLLALLLLLGFLVLLFR